MTTKRIPLGASMMVAAVLCLVVTACNNDKLTSINRNPNAPADISPSPVFTNAVVTTVGRWMGATAADMRGTEFIIQHQTEDQYSDEDRYNRLQAAQTAGLFTTTYSSELEDFKQVISKGMAAKDPSIYGPAEVMTAWDYMNLTNAFGNIPYTQALKADSGVISPAYDPQKTVYAGMFQTLTSAAAALKSATGQGLTGDPIYGGDPAQWRKFANALHARLALLLVNVDPTTANAELTAALKDPSALFQSNADNAQLNWPGDGVFNNPWSDFLGSRDDNRMSRTLMNVLIANNDPRLSILAQPATPPKAGEAATYAQCDADGLCTYPTPSSSKGHAPAGSVLDGTQNGNSYYGEINGLPTANAVSWHNASRLGIIFFPASNAYGAPSGGNGPKQPSYLMTYAEQLFIEAEAAERGMAGLSASQAAGFYNAAITASMQQWGVSDATAIAAYLAQPSVAYKGGTQGLQQIALQKYIHLFTDGQTAWAEWRRTCVPSTIVAGPGTLVPYVPRRFDYAPIEANVNGTNLQAAIAAMGGNTFATRVYFDTKPDAAPTYVTDAVCTGGR